MQNTAYFLHRNTRAAATTTSTRGCGLGKPRSHPPTPIFFLKTKIFTLLFVAAAPPEALVPPANHRKRPIVGSETRPANRNQRWQRLLAEEGGGQTIAIMAHGSEKAERRESST